MLAGPMRRTPARSGLLLCALLACRPAAPTTKPADGKSSEAKTDAQWSVGFEVREGLFSTYVDPRAGRLHLVLPASHHPVLANCLYVATLATGLGSSAVGLDRGELSSTRWVQFRRVGQRILVEELNTRFRADSNDDDERKAAADSFPTSVLWAGDITRELENGDVVLDITSFAVRDAHHVSETLEQAEQGRFSLDPDRSAFDQSSLLAFPDNLEFEARLTFEGSDSGGYVRRSTPDPTALTLVLHHSFVRLPDADYRPRPWHAASGTIDLEFVDFAVPLSEPLHRHVAVRHRLQKRPGAQAPIEPIVYYVDRGAPEPIRSALIEGASWWREAFEAAGFRDAFRVELLPLGVHPLDVRYNVIQWVHRQRRGWSYGSSIRDPRTGEIIKGSVTLGSQRVRQDILLFEGLAGAGKTGTGGPDDPVQVALSRIRQLSAHEVGHTLGLQHNFAASTYGRASVMDYPAPKVDIVDGNIDLSDAYGVGIGVWDRQAIRYLYSEFAPEQEAASLRAILEESRENGWIYFNDTDARRPESAHPLASLWDNGADPIAELHHALAVRRHALERFGAMSVRLGAEWADLEPVFAPLYFHHRYQQTAAMKWIGGLWYDRGPRTATSVARPVEAPQQRRALDAVLAILDPAVLDVPERVLERLAPGQVGERFGSETWPAFDGLGAAATAAQSVLDELLDPARMARVVDFQRRDSAQLGLEEVQDRIVDRVFRIRPQSARHAEITRVVQSVTVDAFVRVARRQDVPARVRDRLDRRLARLLANELAQRPRAAVDREHRAALSARIRRHLDRPAAVEVPAAAPQPSPPGSPIGSESSDATIGCGGDHGLWR